MEAVLTSETSVNFNVTTRRYIPEDSKPHARLRENLKISLNKGYCRFILKKTENVRRNIHRQIKNVDETWCKNMAA
jgi:hypothetical protein